MRGDEKQQDAMFSYINLEQRVPPEHPLRAIRQMVDQALGDLSAHFDTLYARGDGPRFLPSNCCGPCYYRCCTGCAVSGN